MELKPVYRQIKKVALGENHAVFLFAYSAIGVIGSNSHGQLGLPFDPEEEDNNFETRIRIHKKFSQLKEIDHVVSDIAAGTNHTLLLSMPANFNLARMGKEERKVWAFGDRRAITTLDAQDTHIPHQVKFDVMEEQGS